MPKLYDQDHDELCPCYFEDDMLNYLYEPHFKLWEGELDVR